MKHIEFKLNLNKADASLFLSEGSFKPIKSSSPFHRHGYTEVHITKLGKVRFNTTKDSITAHAGDVTVIPAGMAHRMIIEDGETQHFAFLIDYAVEKFTCYRVSDDVISELVREAESFYAGCETGTLLQCLAFVCKDFMKQEASYSSIDNREFLMREFFAYSYNKPVGLSTLAEVLQLSPKQTARLVNKYMGNNFEAVLLEHRREAARLLMETDSTLTLTEIAQLVGYNSYSGFWKAMKGTGEKE